MNKEVTPEWSHCFSVVANLKVIKGPRNNFIPVHLQSSVTRMSQYIVSFLLQTLVQNDCVSAAIEKKKEF